MKLEKAIEILNDLNCELDIPQRADQHTATQLGIEALKEIKILRHLRNSLPRSPLPGETPPDPPAQRLPREWGKHPGVEYPPHK